jgi:hypothetical protein
MEWLNTLNSWAPVIWIALSGALLLIWYQSIRSKHRLDIKHAAVQVLRRRVARGRTIQERIQQAQARYSF